MFNILIVILSVFFLEFKSDFELLYKDYVFCLLMDIAYNLNYNRLSCIYKKTSQIKINRFVTRAFKINQN